MGSLQPDDDAHGPQQYRLPLRQLVGGDQRRTADRVEPAEDVVLPQVGEERVPDVGRRQAELGRRRRHHRLGIERRRVVEYAPGRRGAGEYRPPERRGVDVVPHLEPAAVLDELAQSPHQPVVGRVVGHIVARRLEDGTGITDRCAGGGDVLFRHGQEPIPLGRSQRRNLDTRTAASGPYEIRRQHCAPAGGRW